MEQNLFEEAISKWQSAIEAASLEGDLLRESKASCAMSVAYRILGYYDEALQYVQLSWKLSCSFVDEAQKISASLWVDLVSHCIELNSDLLAQSTGKRKDVNMPHPYVSNPVKEMQGPAIVVWFMQLTTAFGNAYYALGKHELSIRWHDICLSLADKVYEKFPMPYSPDDPVILTLPRLKLSFVHRSTLLAQIRSLTHIGLCFQQLGQEQNAVSFHTHSQKYIRFLLHHSPSTPHKSPFIQKEECAIPVAKIHQSLPTAANSPIIQLKTTSTDISFESAQKYHAAVLSNIGNSYYAKGLIPVSMDRHLRAAAMFRELDDNLGHARESANIGALWIELGRTITILEWLKRCNLFCNLQTRDAEIAAKENWGPPGLSGIKFPANTTDESTKVASGMKFLKGGTTHLYEQLEILKKCGDWAGMCTIWMNLAAGYCLMHQPHWALHNITRLLSSPRQTPNNSSINHPLTPTSKSAHIKSSNKYTTTQLFNRIPRNFLPNIFHSILQSLVLLEHAQPTSKEDSVDDFGLSPTIISSNTNTSRTSSGSGSSTTTITPEITNLVNELINHIQPLITKELQSEMKLTDPSQNKSEVTAKIKVGELQEGDIKQLIEQMINWSQTLMNQNASLKNTDTTSLLMPNLSFDNTNTSSLFHWSELTNFTKQQWLLSHAAHAKLNWLKGSQMLPNSLNSKVKSFAEQNINESAGFLAQCAEEILYAAYGKNQELWNIHKPIAEFVGLSLKSKMLSKGKPWESPLSGLASASLFVLLADMLANVVVYGNSNPKFRESIFELLGVQMEPLDNVLASFLMEEGYDLGGNKLADSVQYANDTRRDVAHAGKLLFAGLMGVCGNCVEDILSLDEKGKADIQFYKLSEKAEREGTGRTPPRSTYPCKHFDWSEYRSY
ncbi:hypothetical protein HK096_009221 [Nowakowskiella sp. JEL0078]|nr:hypothetical protein HK096_009221 [Nowakowskiella sp. JEL0078]